jgi:limonene-1,2-epoxide hydrolase
VAQLLAAIEARDLLAIESALHVDATWQNVPHPPSVGRDAVVASLAPILGWSDAVRWDVVSASYEAGSAWIERVDRFVIDGTEYAVACNGVFAVDADGLVTSVRDYADIGEWRQRIEPVYRAMRSRSAVEVVARHLAAVERRDGVAMSADYALDATLTRGERQYRGYREIAGYFAELPARLGERRLTLSAPAPVGSRDVEVRWSIDDEAVGVDRYVVDSGWIRSQVVTLEGPDF